MTDNEILNLRRFCQEITYRPRMMDCQSSAKSNGFLWCEDWEMIEILKYLFLGEVSYFNEAPPRRLRNNPLWSKEDIKAKAQELLSRFNNNVEAIIEHLRSTRNNATSRIA